MGGGHHCWWPLFLPGLQRLQPQGRGAPAPAGDRPRRLGGPWGSPRKENHQGSAGGRTTVFRIFGDESCTHSGEFRVQGALWVKQGLIASVRRELASVRRYRTGGGPAEIKWSEVRGRRLRPRVKALVDLFFTSSAASAMHFNTIIISHKDDPSRRAGASQLSLSKAWHLLFRYRLWPNSDNYIDLDERPGWTAGHDYTLRSILNRTGCRSQSTVGLLRSVQSCSDDLIQLTDLLVGATAWEWNGRSQGSGAKAQLHEHICHRLHCSTLLRETIRHPKFDRWRYRPDAQRAA